MPEATAQQKRFMWMGNVAASIAMCVGAGFHVFYYVGLSEMFKEPDILILLSYIV